MQLPPEVLRAEILDWWEAEQERMYHALLKRLPALYYHVDQKIADMPVKAFIRKGKFHAETIEPIVIDWIETLYRELTHDLDDSFRASSKNLEGKGIYDSWSYGEMASAGAAIAVSVAPAAGVPFFAGGLTVAGFSFLGITIGGGALVPLAVTALAGSVVMLAAGPAVRGKAASHLLSRFRSVVHEAIDIRVLGDSDDPSIPSLKGRLLGELHGVALKRIEMVE
ncbi:hypothetical protein [Roseovarius mucosus]|uniref:hypothetical protein n=1 Tax=Roseovarius mucosus TaxID=215743 RepID=UPI003BA98BA5